MMEPTTEIAVYNTKVEVDVAVARLSEADVEAFVNVDNLGGTFPMMQMTTGGFKLRVRNADISRARDILSQEFPNIESQPPLVVSNFQRATRTVTSPRATRVRVLVYIILVFLAVVAIVLSTTRGPL